VERTGLAGEIPLVSREAELGRILTGLSQPRPAAFEAPEGLKQTLMTFRHTHR